MNRGGIYGSYLVPWTHTATQGTPSYPSTHSATPGSRTGFHGARRRRTYGRMDACAYACPRGGWFAPPPLPPRPLVDTYVGPSRRHRRLRYLAGVSRRVHVGLCSRRESVDAARKGDKVIQTYLRISFARRRVGCEYLAITAAGSVGLLVSSVRGEAGDGWRTESGGGSCTCVRT